MLLAQARLASFPGSSAWVDEKEPGTHCLRMLSSPRISGNLEIFRKILLRYTNLRKVCRLLPYKRWLSLTTLRVDDDEGAKKVLSSSFAGIVHAFVHSSQTLQHVTDAMSSFEVHRSLQTKQCTQLPSKRYCF